MSSVELFFDRTVGTSIPEAMRRLGLKNVYHHHSDPKDIGMRPIPGQRGLFKHDVADDVFLEFVGQRGWFVIGQDYNYHTEDNLLEAIRAFKVGVFYIWGANAPRWETMRYLARGYPEIIRKAQTVERPFIFKIGYNGKFRKIL